ncbi:hypothetical protein JB92DRAFT_2245214 [Gautieria morchelliformis]|nr:hypothetical protein JB92DRAFT_2245214 [Gautieria morchelliformis]
MSLVLFLRDANAWLFMPLMLRSSSVYPEDASINTHMRTGETLLSYFTSPAAVLSAALTLEEKRAEISSLSSMYS